LIAQFYPITIQRQKEKEFSELKMSNNMTVMQYASKFIELSRFVLKYMAFERLKMRKFEEGLAIYIHSQLASQPIYTYQELCEKAAEVDRVKARVEGLEPKHR